MQKISIIGAGAWGTALALAASRALKDVTLWAREQEVISAIKTKNENTPFLPNVALNDRIHVTNDLIQAVQNTDAILWVVPAQFLRKSLIAVKNVLDTRIPVVICAKGIEQNTGALLSEIMMDEIPNATIAVLSGPTFAIEAALEKPTALTLACLNEKVGLELIDSLGTKTFRPYYSDDIIGVQVGGAVKNVMAIAAGIVEGKKLGDNARAALITRGLAEISRFSTALGGHPETLMGLSGLGDLVLTANSTQSRNFTVGVGLGQGKTINEILTGKSSVAEGVYTATAVVERAQKLGIEMPICEGLVSILTKNTPVDNVLSQLLSRPFKAERSCG